MGWVNDRFDNRTSNVMELGEQARWEQSFEANAQRVWEQLVSGFEQDCEEYRARDGSADFSKSTDTECRISSSASGIAVIVAVDLPAHMIHYVYEPNNLSVAVPEQGVLTLRPGDSSVQIYSADQHLGPDQARRMILEPLLFPLTQLEDTGT
jgi:hypothetical protein